VRLLGCVALLALCGGCARTFIPPASAQKAQSAAQVRNTCNVRDFDSATDLPQGARSLGPVSVQQAESDEATYVALRQKICELGGDALSQAAWVKGPEDEKPQLTANAWALP
jgi:hypothetical protein